MKVKSIKICQFRNFHELEVTFSPKITILYGDNATGKTSIIEAINCVSTVKSFRTNDSFELINDKSDYFYLECSLLKEQKSEKVTFYCDNKTKRIKINNFLYTKLSNYVGFFNVVCFSALDFLKLKGSSIDRRKMFDLVFCQISKDYLIVSNYYKKVLKDRNALLKRLSFENRSDLQKLLDVVTEQLINYGNQIIELRKKYLLKIADYAKENHYKISNNSEGLSLNYFATVDKLTEEDFLKVYSEDLRKGYTTIGPHRDDYIFIINNKNVALYGSQGQQRNAMLSVKLGMADLINEIKKEAPTLLLDDVFSELDKNRQNSLINSLNPDYQTIITTASISDLDNKILDNALIVELNKRSE